MLCPICKTVNLQLAERHGIEIDYCPQCRGIWLDRGEIDKMVDHFAKQYGAKPAPAPEKSGRDSYERQRYDRESSERDRRRRVDDDDDRRGGFLGGLMDIFD